MEIVAGISLNNLKPRVWDPQSPHYLPALKAVMVSYADFHGRPRVREEAMKESLRSVLGIPANIKVYLDNGAFCFARNGVRVSSRSYRDFVERSRPGWRPVARDFIPAPRMTADEQRECLKLTMQVNKAFAHDGYAPVIHISKVLPEYIEAIRSNPRLTAKKGLALGGVVPHLLRTNDSQRYEDVLAGIHDVRRTFAQKQIHLFGVGGTATLHLAALLGMNSVDSSGWRNRAARGMIQLPGTGERVLADLGSWRGRRLTQNELQILEKCQCPACRVCGADGLRLRGINGFCNRATHNLWTLLQEAKWVEEHLTAGTYRENYQDHLDNATYRPLIDFVVREYIG